MIAVTCRRRSDSGWARSSSVGRVVIRFFGFLRDFGKLGSFERRLVLGLNFDFVFFIRISIGLEKGAFVSIFGFYV